MFDKIRKWFFRAPIEKRKKSFAQLVAGELRKTGIEQEIDYDETEFTLRIGREQVLNLGNFFQEFEAQDGDGRVELLSRVVSAVLGCKVDLPVTFEEAASSLMVTVRNPIDVALASLHFKLDGQGTFQDVFEPLAPGLDLALAFDMPTTIRLVTSNDLAGWDVSFSEARDVGIKNLSAKSTEFFDELSPGVYIGPWTDSYGAARIVLFDKIKSLALKGFPVVLVPTRDTIIITGAEDLKGMELALEAATSALESGRRISGKAYSLEGVELELFSLPTALENKFKLLDIQVVANDYAAQKVALDKFHGEREIDIFVASYFAMQNEQGKLFTYSTWTKGVVTLLPRQSSSLSSILKNQRENRHLDFQLVNSRKNDQRYVVSTRY